MVFDSECESDRIANVCRLPDGFSAYTSVELWETHNTRGLVAQLEGASSVSPAHKDVDDCGRSQGKRDCCCDERVEQHLEC